jgi:hypothetical protein
MTAASGGTGSSWLKSDGCHRLSPLTHTAPVQNRYTGVPLGQGSTKVSASGPAASGAHLLLRGGCDATAQDHAYGLQKAAGCYFTMAAVPLEFSV